MKTKPSNGSPKEYFSITGELLPDKMLPGFHLFGGLLIFLPMLVLIGWQFDIRMLMSPLPSMNAMNPITAITFVLCGISFMLLISKQTLQRNIGKITSSIVLVIGLLRLVNSTSEWDISIDLILYNSKLDNDGIVTRMAPNTAFNFILTAIALLALHYETRRKRMPAQFISLILFLAVLLSMLIYFYRVEKFTGILAKVPMAPYTAVCFFLVGLSILFTHPDKGLMKELNGPYSGSVMARYLIPAAIIVPAILGYLRLLGGWLGIFSVEFGVSILVLTIIVFFLILTWSIVILLNKRDIIRQHTDLLIRQQEALVQNVFQSSPDALVIIKMDGTITLVNKQCENIFGYKQEELIGKQIEILIPERFHKNHPGKREHFFAAPKARPMGNGLELFARRRDSSEFPVEISLSPMQSPEGLLVSATIRDISARKLQDEKIKFLATIADNIQDPIIASDKNFRTTNWNHAAEKLFEWKSEEVIGKTTREILNIIYPFHSREQVLQAFSENGYWQGEVIYHTKSGKPLNILATASHLKDANETVTGILVVAKDITDRKRAEEKLIEFEHFFNNSHDLCGIANSNGYFENINFNFSKVLGYSEKEFCETPFIELVHPDDIASTLYEYEKLKSGASVINFVNRYRKKDGNYLYLDWNATPNPLSGKLYCVARDITERTLANEKIHFLATITSHIEDIVIASDNNFKITYWNEAAEKLLGWKKEEVLGKSTSETLAIKYPDERTQIVESFSGKGYWQGEATYYTKSGNPLPVLGTASSLKDAKGVATGHLVLVRDITERKKTELALNKLNAELEQRVIERTGDVIKSEKRFRALIENNHDIISLMDESFKIIYRSPSAVRITGWTDEDLKDSNGTKNIHPDDLGMAKTHVQELMTNPGKSLQVSFRNQHKNGHYLWVEGTVINLLHDEDVKAIVFNFRDITQRKELENLLHKSNALARIGGWEVDLVKGTVFWSDITREIHETENDYVPDLETGINFYKKEKDRDIIRNKVNEAITLGKPWDEVLQIVTAKNNERWVRTIGETEFVGGKCVRIYGSFQDIDQRKKAEEKLAHEQALLRTLIDNLPDFIYVKDRQSRHLISNKANVELMGASTEKETIGKTVNDFLSAEIGTSYLEDDQVVFKTGTPIINREESIVSKTGEKKFLLTTKVPLRDGANSITGLVGISRDITWQKLAEHKLLQSEAFNRGVIDSLSAHVAVMNESGEIVAVNNAWNQFTLTNGLTALERTGVGSNYYHVCERAAMNGDSSALEAMRGIRKVMDGENAFFELEYPCHSPKEYRWFNMRVMKFSHNLPMVVVAHENITDRKRVEMEIIESEERFRSLYENSQEAILLTKTDGSILSANPAACKMFGRSEVEICQIGRSGIVNMNDSRIPLGLEERKRTGRIHDDWTFVKKDGTVFTGEITSTIFLNSRGEEMSSVFIRDITERKKAEEEIKELTLSLERKVNERTNQLQAVNKELEAFSYSVSHDLRAPLRSIDGYAHILEEDYNDKLDEEGRRVISVITRNATRMGQLIDDMLAFSKYGKMEMALATVNMKDVVEVILNELVANEKDRIIHAEVGNLHASRGDVDMLRQVWFNYIANALKFTGKAKETRISIASYLSNGEVCYSIKDNGAGFDNQYVPKLFGVFQRLHKQSEFEGTGVGLATCKRIIERHGGRVWAEGESGKGATFYFSLPTT